MISSVSFLVAVFHYKNPAMEVICIYFLNQDFWTI